MKVVVLCNKVSNIITKSPSMTMQNRCFIFISFFTFFLPSYSVIAGDGVRAESQKKRLCLAGGS